MYLWVLSKCNLSCPFCNAKYGRERNKDYEMGLDELQMFIKSSQDRNLHYSSISITGGEVTLWKYLEEGVKMLFDSKITNKITLSTNGNNPERVIDISNMLDHWVVSKTQATADQIAKYDNFKSKIVFNTTKHRKFPIKPIVNKLPANCCCKQDLIPPIPLLGDEYNGVLYLRGKVYYCILAFTLSQYVNLEKIGAVCNFEDDFISFFKDKKYDKEICSYCLCNRRIWDVTPEEAK